uniref:Uncharacterized protein n=1 Tax=Tetranychus urticae TaxID=32264 RepID=T1K3W5_TETUR
MFKRLKTWHPQLDINFMSSCEINL